MVKRKLLHCVLEKKSHKKQVVRNNNNPHNIVYKLTITSTTSQSVLPSVGSLCEPVSPSIDVSLSSSYMVGSDVSPISVDGAPTSVRGVVTSTPSR